MRTGALAVVDPLRVVAGSGNRPDGIDVLLIAFAAAVGAEAQQVEHDDRAAGIFGEELIKIGIGEFVHHGYQIADGALAARCRERPRSTPHQAIRSARNFGCGSGRLPVARFDPP